LYAGCITLRTSITSSNWRTMLLYAQYPPWFLPYSKKWRNGDLSGVNGLLFELPRISMAASGSA
jgi:hypothetical protein